MSLQSPKTEDQIQAMRDGGQILAQLLIDLKNYIKPGMTGVEADDWVGEQIIKRGASVTYKEPGVMFPGNICISVNEYIVHSLPTDQPFEVGDVVGFDLTITYKGMKVDSAFTMVVGEEPKGVKKHLLNTTERALYAGIEKVRHGVRVGDVSNAIEQVLRKGKLGVVTNLVGHGIGEKIHMPPEVPNFGAAGSGPMLSAGDTIAIEPMASLGGPNIATDKKDGWSIFMKDGSLSAHFEHTVLVTDTGCEILTLLK